MRDQMRETTDPLIARSQGMENESGGTVLFCLTLKPRELRSQRLLETQGGLVFVVQPVGDLDMLPLGIPQQHRAASGEIHCRLEQRAAKGDFACPRVSTVGMEHGCDGGVAGGLVFAGLNDLYYNDAEQRKREGIVESV